MMSSVGYSQVADYTGKPNQQQLLPGQIIAQQAQQAQQQMMMNPLQYQVNQTFLIDCYEMSSSRFLQTLLKVNLYSSRLCQS